MMYYLIFLNSQVIREYRMESRLGGEDTLFSYIEYYNRIYDMYIGNK